MGSTIKKLINSFFFVREKNKIIDLLNKSSLWEIIRYALIIGMEIWCYVSHHSSMV
jgi:hypothetical protein